MKFIIVTTAYGRPDLLQKCIESVREQTYTNYEHFIVVDGHHALYPLDLVGEKTYLRLTHSKLGAMRNLYETISSDQVCSSEDIIIRLDGDDTLKPHALQCVFDVYKKHPETLVTHGSTEWLSGRDARFNGPYKSDNFRQVGWRGGHIMTFNVGLFRKIKQRDFKGLDGNWLMSCSDLAIMYPLMEMAGLDRIQWIPEQIYVYNDFSELNDCKVNGVLQKRMEKYIRKKPRYKRLP